MNIIKLTGIHQQEDQINIEKESSPQKIVQEKLIQET